MLHCAAGDAHVIAIFDGVCPVPSGAQRVRAGWRSGVGVGVGVGGRGESELSKQFPTVAWGLDYARDRTGGSTVTWVWAGLCLKHNFVMLWSIVLSWTWFGAGRVTVETHTVALD
eukprot:m.165924 g.165924  ORF g.165924 m.165924 type:complete len:115 (-) comp24024_c1_seq1:5788-6132(-)